MAPLELEGKSLKGKHQHYNKLVRETIASNTPIEAGDLNSGEYDVENLMKIDIASKNRDVEYILSVLKCEDMLYVSRAIKRSTWLVTERQYAHIINPFYLTTHLRPDMTSNAFIKFVNHIRLHLKNEVQAEQFFNYEEQKNVKWAVKWLPNCSSQFIISKVPKYLKVIEVRLFKRICEKAPEVVECLLSEKAVFIHAKLEAINFLLHADYEKYFNVVEKQNSYCFPNFGIRSTKLLMEQCPDRVINNFEKYCNKIHLPTFVKHLKKENIPDFLFTLAKKDRYSEWSELFFRCHDNVKYFLDAMTKEQRTIFLDQVFFNKTHNQEDVKENSEKFGMRMFYLRVTSYFPEYVYYDFETAFEKITKSIRIGTSLEEKNKMLKILVKSAGSDQEKLTLLLKYYVEKHNNDPLKSKEDIMMEILPQIHVAKLTPEAWKMLDNCFRQMEVYSNSEVSVPPACIEAIILYKVTHGEQIPQIIEKKFNNNGITKITHHSKTTRSRKTRSVIISCLKKPIVEEVDRRTTLKVYRNTLNNEDRDKVFQYLFNKTVDKIQNLKIINESELKTGIDDLNFLLTLLLDWQKELCDFPWVLDKIKEYLKVKKDHSWKIDMSGLYKKKKSWKRLMFEESVSLCPTGMVCLNILKHDSQLISKEELISLRRSDGVSQQQLLTKLRVYWPQTLAAECVNSCLDALNKPTSPSAPVRALCALLPRQQLLQLIRNYAPKEDKIDYKEANEIPVRLQQQLAKHMHLARPRPPPDAILLYAKGDYLKYALPSLLAIYHNLSIVQTRNFIKNLFSAPVSIQKHGIRLSIQKLKTEELLPVFRDIWINTTNCTIRAVVFQFTFSLLSEDKNKADDVWDLLFMFMDNLSHEEDKTIYDIIFCTDNLRIVPTNRLKEYFLKTYKFLKELIPHLPESNRSSYEYRLSSLVEYTKNLMECLPTSFVVDILSDYIEEKFMKKRVSFRHGSSCKMIKVVAAFVLCTKADKTQIERYNMFLDPLLDRCIAVWGLNENNFIRDNFDELLTRLTLDLKEYAYEKQMDNPQPVFENIQKKLIRLSLPENYIMITKWKLTVELAKVLKNIPSQESWDAACVKIAPEFGKICLELLKTDVALHFPCIYVLFTTALQRVLDIMPDKAMWIIYQCLLEDVQFIQGYLAVLKLFPRHESSEQKADAERVRNIVCDHPSVEVKMHYNHKFFVKSF